MKTNSHVAPAKLWQGAFLIGVAYVITYAAASRALAEPDRGLDWAMGPPMAVLLVLVPYLVGGLYCRYAGAAMPRHYPLWLGLVATSLERLFITSVGYLFFATGGDGSMEGISLMMFIQGEAAPYFTWPYITVGGIVSVAITYAVGSKSRAGVTA